MNERVTIGRDCDIHPMALVGNPPQSPTRPAATGRLVIGDRVTIREFASADLPMGQEGAETRIGSGVYVMVGAHVSHNARIDDHAVLSAGAVTSGYTRLMAYAQLGLRSCTHQYCCIGSHAFVGLGAVVVDDVPPFVVAMGNPARYHRINRLGLERAGWSDAEITKLEKLAAAALAGDVDARIQWLAEPCVQEFAAARSGKRRMLKGWDFCG